MAGQVPICENWAITKIDNLDISFLWTVQNFSSVEDVVRPISSPIFLDQKDHFKWILLLFPRGQTNPDYLDVHLHVVQALTKKLIAKFRFSVINDKGQIYHVSDWTQFNEFSNQKRSWGITNFIKKSNLILSNDSVTFYCEIKVNVDFNNELGYNNIIDLSKQQTESHLSQDLFKLFETGLYSDVNLIVDTNKIIKAHSCILAGRSKYFLNLLQKCKPNEMGTRNIKINSYNCEVMKKILTYIYTEKIDVSINTTTLLEAANKFNMTDLKSICEEKLISGLNFINVSSLLIIADDNKAEKLKEKAMEYIINRKSQANLMIGLENLQSTKPNLIIEMFGLKVFIFSLRN